MKTLLSLSVFFTITLFTAPTFADELLHLSLAKRGQGEDFYHTGIDEETTFNGINSS